MALGLYLAAAVVGGLLATAVRLPPLVGYLAAGFALGALDAPAPDGLEQIAELGVVLLLFAIGLKFDVRTLLRREIWLTTSVHLVLSTAVGMGFLGLLAVVGPALVADEPLGALALVGFALSFSSTVLVVKVLEDRSDTTSLYGRIAVGLLVLQDVVAVAFMALAGGEVPSPWALALVLLVPAAWPLHRIWDRIGHGELQALFGVTVAVALGWGLFEALGVHGELGALVMGVLLAKHPSASELSRSLMTFKDLMLVAFFVQIGLHGRPGVEELLMAVALLAVLPLQIAFYAVLLWAMRLRRRTAFLAALVLGNFSEFGIIVAAVGASVGLLGERWVVVISLAVAMSFAVSALINRRGVELATRMVRLLPHHSTYELHPDDRLVDVGQADALVLGLGRIGAATYVRLRDEYGLAVALLAVLPFQVAFYAVLLWAMRLRRRTAFLAGLVLANFSEFGIIVVAVGATAGLLDERWVVVVSLAVAISFAVSALLNRRGVELATRMVRLLPHHSTLELHPDDRLVDVGQADALVLGLGRIGAATYSRLRDEYGLSVVGVEHDQARVTELQEQGFEVLRADATDVEFWARVERAGRIRVVVLAMPFHNANLISLARLHAAGFTGKVAAVARYDDDVAELARHGADAVFHLYGSAGTALADHAAEVLRHREAVVHPTEPDAAPGLAPG